MGLEKLYAWALDAAIYLALPLLSFGVTCLLAWLLLMTVHRPWLSNSWRFRPVIAVIAVCAAIFALVCWPSEFLPRECPCGERTVHAVLCWIGAAVAGFWVYMVVAGRATRARNIVEPAMTGKPQIFERHEVPLKPAPEVTTTGRRIVIFSDGTSNRPDEFDEGSPAPTNVYRLYNHLIKDETQVGWYDAGVGSETSSQAVVAGTAERLASALGFRQGALVAGFYRKIRTIIEAATGLGINENIVQAYTEIVRQYRPGDRIYLLGFSRGAYTARCVAGVIRRCGLLRAENIRYAADAVRLYRTRYSAENDVPTRQELCHENLPSIEFLGLFDTVASLGVPMWGWWFNFRRVFRNKSLSTNPSPICIHIYHALSMDERRSQFFPTLFEPQLAGVWTETFEQVWFRGVHGDIGGGYVNTGLSDIALRWMYDACVARGLKFKNGKNDLIATLLPDALARMHDEIQRRPGWKLMGSWPRWHPVTGTLHPSVAVRAEAIHRLGRNDMRPVGLQPIDFTVEGQREWDRTGLVLEGDGAVYRLCWKGQMKWRDKDCEPCGPEGQDGNDFIRRLVRRSRRLPESGYMTLCLTVAHPRTWRLRELGLGRLIKYMFVRDPKELREQVAPIGTDLTRPNAGVLLKNSGPAGLLYLFANDLWMMSANNSGALDLSIRRLGERERPTDEPMWTLTSREDGKGKKSWIWSREDQAPP
jgi:uncharacterized protein (DUF2235 family)